MEIPCDCGRNWKLEQRRELCLVCGIGCVLLLRLTGIGGEAEGTDSNWIEEP